MPTPSRSLVLLHLALLGATSLRAAEDPPLQLDPLVVTGVPIERSINPLVRPIEGVFGDTRSILETPRAVSSITQALLRERGIEGVREFIGFAAGASGPAAYGKASIPNVRGDLTETFLNGQRVSYNNFGYAPSFNNVEALDVVRGPGSAIYGSGFFTGGYVNYVTKRPQFERETTVTLRLGDWVPSGGSWLNASWQIDTSAPAADGRSAWRVSYEGKDDQTFFNDHGGRDDRQDIYVAWLRRVSDTFTLEANAQYFWQAAPQLLGINRVNQELIDSGRYYTGDLADLGYSDAGAIAGVIPGTSWVDVPRDATLLSAGDISNANVYRGQVIATAAYASGRKLVNRTLFEHVNRRRWHAFEYGEWVEQWTAENRTEWHAAFESGSLAHALVAGATLRWEDRLSYTNYFNEYFFQYDLTRANRVFSHELDYPNSYWPGFAGPGGKLFFPASYGSPETTDSRLFNPAVFLQDEIKFNARTSILAGVRVDGFYAKARDPLGDAAGVPWEDSHGDEGVSWNASLLHKLSPRASVYATYQRALAVHGNVTGGGIMLKEDDAGNGVIDPDDFTNLSRLGEVGAKFSWLENRLYTGVALFDQRREELELGGDVKNLHMRGAEVEFVYQPNLRFNATFNVAYNDGRFDDSSASQAGGLSLYNLYALGQGPGGLGNGLGFQWDKLPPGDYRIPGLSRWVVNGSFSYTHPSGFGGGLNGSWQSEQPGNLTNEYHIPDQIFLNAFLFFRQPKWEVNVDILNVIDERNWIHNGDSFSNHVLVFQDLPLRIEGYVKIKF